MADHHTCHITWSAEDREYLGRCAEFPSLSWLAPTPDEALSGIRELVSDVLADMQANGESPPGSGGSLRHWRRICSPSA